MKQKNILLIEDNEQNRYLATFLLGQHGFKVVSVPDGQAGIELPENCCPT
jgi:two-component system cell cycle response regulator DivK